MIAQNVFFGIFAAAMIAAAFGVVTTKNIVHAALYLIVVLAGSAAQFLLLGAEFVAWVQVLVYIGAVAVLFLFGIMVTQAPMKADERMDNDLRWPAAVASVFLAGTLGWLLWDGFDWDTWKIDLEAPTRTIEISSSVFRQYVLPFEVTGFLLLAALVGAVVMARRD